MSGAITVAGLPSSQKTPGTYLSVILGGAGASAGAASKKLLLMGNMIVANLTGGGGGGVVPAWTVTAGTDAVATPTFLSGPDDAGARYGLGSELHLMAKVAFANNPGVLCYGCAVGESAGARGTLVLTMVGSATAAQTVTVYCDGRSCQASVASGDTVTTIAVAIGTAINQQSDWPITAINVAGVLTLTSRQLGTRANNITFRGDVLVGTTVSKFTGAALAVTAGGTTFTMSGGTVAGSSYHFTNGAGVDAGAAAALAAVATVRYDRIALCYDGADGGATTTLAAVLTQVDSMAGVLTQKLQQVVFATNVASAAAITLATGRNKARASCIWHYASEVSTGEIAAAVAAARLGGDALAGGTAVGEASDPACNLDGLQLIGVPAQFAVSDQPLAATIESVLNSGLTPLQPSGLNPGGTSVVRCVTTRSLDGASNPNYAVLDTSEVTITDYMADTLRVGLSTTYASFKLGVDAADGTAPKIPRVATPSMLRVYAIGLAKDAEAAGILTNVDAHLSQFQFVADPNAAGRVNFEYPVPTIKGLHITAGNVRQITA